MTRKTVLTFISVFMAASLPLATTAQAGKGARIGLGIVAGAVVLGAMANAAQKNKAKAKQRARSKAKARARAQQRAAAKRKAQQRKAYAAKKKKAAQQKAYAAAKKKKAAEKRHAIAAQKAKEQKVAAAEAKARAEAEAQAKADAEKTEGSFVAAPSTAALLTSKEIADADKDDTANNPTEVAVVKTDDAPTTETTPVVETKDGEESGCKRFIPAVSLTVSVGC